MEHAEYLKKNPRRLDSSSVSLWDHKYFLPGLPNWPGPESIF